MEKMKNGKSKMEKRKRSLRKDERGVSPVIGVIMMIAIVVIIAAVVAAFAYGIIGGVKKAPSSALVVEGVSPSLTATNVTIFHHGGDSIVGAFVASQNVTGFWDNLEVRQNGAPLENGTSGDNTASGAWLNAKSCGINTKTTFAPGDELKIRFNKLTDGDSLVILHVPSENILQRITVAG